MRKKFVARYSIRLVAKGHALYICCVFVVLFLVGCISTPTRFPAFRVRHASLFNVAILQEVAVAEGWIGFAPIGEKLVWKRLSPIETRRLFQGAEVACSTLSETENERYERHGQGNYVEIVCTAQKIKLNQLVPDLNQETEKFVSIVDEICRERFMNYDPILSP